MRSELSPAQEQAPSAILQHHFLTHHTVDPGFVDQLIDDVILPLVTSPRP